MHQIIQFLVELTLNLLIAFLPLFVIISLINIVFPSLGKLLIGLLKGVGTFLTSFGKTIIFGLFTLITKVIQFFSTYTFSIFRKIYSTSKVLFQKVRLALFHLIKRLQN